jgi:hypothetical protein
MQQQQPAEGEYDIISTDDIDSTVTQPAGKMIIPISRAGVVAGTVAASVGYTVTNALVRNAGTATGFTLNVVGYIMEKAAGLIAGPAGELTVSVTRKLVAETAQGSIVAHAPVTALVVSSVAGAGTCLAVTAGSAAIGLIASSVKKIAIGAANLTDRYKTNGTPTESFEKDNNSIGHRDDRSA